MKQNNLFLTTFLYWIFGALCNCTLFSKDLDWFLLADMVNLGTTQMTYHKKKHVHVE